MNFVSDYKKRFQEGGRRIRTMRRIALFAGTTEGRRIAEYAAASGIHMDVYCATEYGTSLMPASEYLHPFTGRLDASMIREALR